MKVCDDELQAIFDVILQGRPSPSFEEFIGIRIDSPDLDTGYITFEMTDAIVGNPTYRTLQGGVIATVLDIVGGHVVFVSVFKQVKGKPLEKQMQRLSKVGTIDLRVDYLRPGTGKNFTAKGWILRTGNKVSVTRMELHNDQQELIAVGTGTYTVG
ncbi:MAG: thioesterase family protein [Chloroflexi bacterium]|nr:thioesterase family protein [Chloroflexota bacterium]